MIARVPIVVRQSVRRMADDVWFHTGRMFRSVLGRLSLLDSPEAAFPESTAATKPRPLRPSAKRRVPPRSATPDVSFVIPVYNSAAWLDDCLSSVLAQTEVDVEAICINDGSTDDSLAILRRIAASDSRVTIIDQPNSGQSVGRNRGVESAAGRYIIYLDSDDYWPADILATLVRRADRDNLDVLLFDCIAFRDGDVDDTTWQWYSTYYQRAHGYRRPRPGVDLLVAMRRRKDYRPHVGLYLARASFIRDLDLAFIPGIVHQDNPYTFRLMLNARKAAHEPVNAYARRIRPGSTITSLSAERSARGYFLSYLDMVRELERHRLPRSTVATVRNIVDYVYRGARRQVALIPDDEAEALRTVDDSPRAQAIFHALRWGTDEERR